MLHGTEVELAKGNGVPIQIHELDAQARQLGAGAERQVMRGAEECTLHLDRLELPSVLQGCKEGAQVAVREHIVRPIYAEVLQVPGEPLRGGGSELELVVDCQGLQVAQALQL